MAELSAAEPRPRRHGLSLPMRKSFPPVPRVRASDRGSSTGRCSLAGQLSCIFQCLRYLVRVRLVATGPNYTHEAQREVDDGGDAHHRENPRAIHAERGAARACLLIGCFR